MSSQSEATPAAIRTHPRSTNEWGNLLPFALTIFISAFLLFQVQLIIAKYILPWWGGTPAVWTTCLLFFQVLLLGGYGYAHALASKLSARQQARLHGALLVVAVIVMALLAMAWPSPITPGANWKPVGTGLPILRILALLSASVGLPFFLLSTTGPLMQSWFSRTRPQASPYWLYALSNVGSLLGLLSYPVLIEPYLRLHIQAWMWAAGFAVFAAACLFCAFLFQRNAATRVMEAAEEAAASGSGNQEPDAASKVLWFCLAACASLMLLATTNLITQEVAVIPFLWVLPLALYLLSFILCFQSAFWYKRKLFQAAFIILAAIVSVLLSLSVATLPLVFQIATFSAVLFVICMICHGELARMKPHPQHLTGFYFMISAGGAAGGLFVAILAPLCFNGFWEYHIGLFLPVLLLGVLLLRDKQSWLYQNAVWPWLAIVLALRLTSLLLRHAQASEPGAPHAMEHLVLIALAGLLLLSMLPAVERRLRLPHLWLHALCLAAAVYFGGSLVLEARTHFKNLIAIERNFYGVVAVTVVPTGDPNVQAYEMEHGHTVHGAQIHAPALRRYPTVYYSFWSGAGVAMLNHPKRSAPDPQQRSLRVGLVGMGTGTMAAYGVAGDSFRFYEINPRVIAMATGPQALFTFVNDSAAQVTVAPGDARLSLERELAQSGPQNFDLLMVDAFNSDAIPVHLLTREAFTLYLKHLAPDGLLVLHITNRSLDLTPVVYGLADAFHLERARFSFPNRGRFIFKNQYVVLSRTKEFFQQPTVAQLMEKEQDVHFRPVPLWTDDYSNLFRVLR